MGLLESKGKYQPASPDESFFEMLQRKYRDMVGQGAMGAKAQAAQSRDAMRPSIYEMDDAQLNAMKPRRF